MTENSRVKEAFRQIRAFDYRVRYLATDDPREIILKDFELANGYVVGVNEADPYEEITLGYDEFLVLAEKEGIIPPEPAR